MICLSANNDRHTVTKIFTMFLFECKHALKDVTHFQKRNCSIRHVANQQSNVTSLLPFLLLLVIVQAEQNCLSRHGF